MVPQVRPAPPDSLGT